jgi:hypothetical protein
MKHVGSLLIAIVVSACATGHPENKEALSAEVNATINQQMTLKQVTAAMHDIGFNCIEGTVLNPNAKGRYACSRTKKALSYTCIHSVEFDAALPSDLVDGIAVSDPVCAGL